MKKAIALAGTILVDKINQISAYPKEGELTKINDVKMSVGGCVPNVGIDIKRIDQTIDVYAVGRIGNDQEGRYVKDVLNENGVDTDFLTVSNARTSFTEVMSVTGGQRTFFTYPGASSEFGFLDIPFKKLDAKMLHLGYLLLLDKVDNGDGEKILRCAKELGIKTSIDLVSENSDRYSSVIPCLKYADNVIVNELEAGKIAKIQPTEKNLKEISQKIKSYGVSERVIIHTPKFSTCLSNDGYVVVPSYDLPNDFIQGTTGAGDAFCAGALIGIYRDYRDEDVLALASATAVCALSKADAISGMRSESEIEKLCKNFNRRKLCL